LYASGQNLTLDARDGHGSFRPIAVVAVLWQHPVMLKDEREDIPKVGYDSLMHVVCVEWGFCGCIKHGQRLHVDYLIPSEGFVTAD
jgi:hypothetical protein